MIFTDDEIILVAKVFDKEKYRKIIKKDEIKLFNLAINAHVTVSGKHRYISIKARIKILLENDKKINFEVDSSTRAAGSIKDFIFELIKLSPQIPNFKYRIQDETKYVKKEIEYFIQHGKKMPWLVKLKVSSFAEKLKLAFICVCFFPMLFSIGMLIFLNLPAPKLSDAEIEFMNHYNSALDLRSKKKQYDKALTELDKAETYVDADSGLYLEKAYNFKRLKRYDEAIENALKGLQFTSEKPVRFKYHNYKFIKNSDDLALYKVLGECYMKKNDYINMFDAYNYLVEHSKYTYADFHFWRGFALYYQSKFDEAREDFAAHKAVIQSYFDFQNETEYKDTYPRYSQKDLDNVNAWLEACDKYAKK